jgi:hypothetical protein
MTRDESLVSELGFRLFNRIVEQPNNRIIIALYKTGLRAHSLEIINQDNLFHLKTNLSYICGVGLEVVYLLFYSFLANMAGPGVCFGDLVLVGLTPRKRPRGVGMAYEQTPARTHAPNRARATLVM